MKELVPALSESLRRGEFLIAEERYPEPRAFSELSGLEGNRVRVIPIFHGNVNNLADIFAARGIQAQVVSQSENIFYLVVGPEDFGRLEELLGD